MAATTSARRPSGPILSVTHRPASPTRVKLSGVARSPGPSVSVSASSPAAASPAAAASGRRRTCMCSPTTHPGSFRCSFHKAGSAARDPSQKSISPPSPPATASRLGARRPAMGCSLVRVGAVEGGGGEWARRALAAAARPSPAAQQRRRGGCGGFMPRPSRLSVMSVAGDRSGDSGI